MIGGTMSNPKPLPLWDRKAGKLTQEFMEDSPATYETHPHRSLTNWLQSQPAYDWLIAAYNDTRLSARKIEPFIKKHKIDMSEFEPGPHRTYAEFFERPFRAGARSFPSAPLVMGAFAEARYFAWEKLLPRQEFPIKGHSLNAEHLLGSADKARLFEGGPVILARLAPVDYHHLHYPDDGTTIDNQRLGKRLWTVNANALRNQPDILFRNERVVQILETRKFGRLGFVEIGALSVGRIVQKHPIEMPFTRGAQKSVFRFGGSAVVLFGEPGAWRPSEDLLRKTLEGVNTMVRLGEEIASAGTSQGLSKEIHEGDLNSV
jgi:phosphatidylserine decarboxylase